MASFTFLLVNDGNVALKQLGIAADDTIQAFTCNDTLPANLAVGAVLDCSLQHNLTQAEVEQGTFTQQFNVTVSNMDPPVALGLAPVTITANPALQVVTVDTFLCTPLDAGE